MTGIDPKGPDEEVTLAVQRDYEEDNEPEGSFYVEKASRLIYEVRFFPDFALVRPAHPHFSASLERLDLMTFANNFDEFLGDPQVLKDFMWGADIDSMVIEKKN